MREKRGYYAHSDIKHFKEFFEKYPVFILSNEKINGFSLKFKREFEKNKRMVKWSIMQILQQEIRSLCLFVRDSNMKILGR